MKFFLFRVSVVPSGEATLFMDDLTDADKNQVILDAIHAKTEVTYRGADYRFSNFLDGQEHIAGRISRPGTLELSNLDDEGDLIDGLVESFRWSRFLYIGEGVQVIAVAQKNEFFSGTVRGMSRLLKTLISEGISDERLSCAVYPIMDEKEFWSVVYDSSSIREIKFELVAPNLFGAGRKAAGYLKWLRDKYKSTVLKYSIVSDAEAIEVSEQDKELQEAVEYSSEGGGRWAIVSRSKKTGRLKRYSSDASQAEVTVREIKDDEDSMIENVGRVVVAILKRVRRK